MPELRKIESDAEFTPPEGSVVQFFAEEDDKILIKAKKSDGTVSTLSGGGGGSSSMEFYQCSDVAQGAQYYEVSGATAFPDCNGNYYLTDIISPIDGVSPVWKHETKTMYLFGVYEIAQITPDYTGDSGNLYHAYGYDGGTFPATGWEDVDWTDMGLSVAFKTAPPTEKTWSGYRAVWSDKDGYTLEKTVTEGLSYGTGFVPKIGGIYNENATIEITKLFEAVKPITTNDTSCLIYIDGTILSNQALAPDKQEVTFGSSVSISDGKVVTPNEESGRITTLSRVDGFGGSLTEWTWDYCFTADGDYLGCSGHSNRGWCLEGRPGSSMYFRGQEYTAPLNVTFTKNSTICISMQWDNGVLHVWDKGRYVGTANSTFQSSTGEKLGIGMDVDSGMDNRGTDTIRLFRFSNKARYTPGVDFELPEGFI